MSALTEPGLQEEWRYRWKSFLRRVEDVETSKEARNVLRDKVTIGNAERKIAGGHEGREILELLQNARDAIWNGDSERGRVHIGVYDEGVLVANTGSRFDLFNPKVEDAVTMIGETGKGDDDDKSIGYKGVGLKSILATGDAFEIFTRPEKTSGDILGVRLSRAYLISSLLSRLGYDNSPASLTDDIADSELRSLLTDGTRNNAVPLTDDLSESISKLPLFNFPVPLSTDQASSDPIRNRVRKLLTEPPTGSGDEPFRTAVFIRYEDTAWRSHLSEIGVSVPDEDEGSIEDRPERIWQYLSAEEEESGLQPETIVQLGGIEELRLERATSAGDDIVSEERWEVIRNPSSNTTISELSHDEVRVRIYSQDSTETVHGFDQFRFSEPRQYHTALLVNKAIGDEATPIESYPLYLFYPIEGTNTAQLPFCLHGRFRVETNRKALSSNNADANQRVLEEGIDLIELVGREVATAANNPESPRYSNQLPWVLLPPVPEADDLSDPSSDELVDWFRQGLLRRLSDTECIPTADGPTCPKGTLLHWDESIIGGYVAFDTILDELDRNLGQIAASPLPTQRTLKAILAMPSNWSGRVKALLRADDEHSISGDILSGWVEHLDDSLSMDESGSPAISVPAPAARSLLKGTVTLLTAATDDGSSLKDILDNLAERFDRVYLLPCQIRDVDPDDQLALVTLEQRRTPRGGQMRRRRVRSVIWDIESATRDVDRPPTPPQSSNMTVYFLDEQVQGVSDVHHVLSVAGRAWGLRAYEAMPSFVRSLLDTFADGRHDVVEPIDFAFLAAIVNRLGTESDDLQTDEGAFFPLEYLRTAVTKPEGNQRGNLRRRVQLRTCELHLHEDTPKPICGTILGDRWQTIRKRGQSGDEESQPTEEWQNLESDEFPGSTWPEPDAATWEVFRRQIRREVTDLDFARTLALLGASTLPGVRILWMYGDEHPSMQQNHHWNPVEWTSGDFVGSVPDRVCKLQSALTNVSDYLTLITSPGHHPQDSADHSQKCPVKLSGELDQVNLASWIWIEDAERLNDHGDVVRELLRRHGDALDSTLLRTGWSCNHKQHNRRAWTESVPSLLNWQLRELNVWNPVVEVNEELTTEWGEQASRLRYAVRLESRRGPQAARMFPHIGEDSGFSDDLLATFGVRPVDELEMTGATERLQKLQDVLVDGSLPKEGTMQLWIPGERINDWNQAYTQLLQPVLKQLPNNGESEDNRADWGALTHLPLRDGDQWVTASIDWIVANADRIRYYPDQSPKPWETQAVEEKSYYILPRTAGGPFRRLAAVLGIEKLQASKLVFDLEADDLIIATDRYSDEVADFRRVLAERRDVLVASTERTDEEEIIGTADDISTAAANIGVAESFPDDALRQLSDPTSALYATEDDQEALLLNASKSDDSLSLDDLAMGLALLVERPTKVATFREALRSDIEVEELEHRWAKRTFPIETVKRILGSNALRSIERDIAALNDLLVQLDELALDPEPMLTALEDANSEMVADVREWLATGQQPNAVADDEHADTNIEPVEGTVTNLWTALPDELAFVADGLFGDSITHWVRELEAHNLNPETENIVIEWLDGHRAALERPPFDNSAKQAYNRFRTITDLWEQTDTAELTEIETWVDRLRELHSNTSISWTESAPKEHAAILDCPPFVVHVCINDRVKVLVDEFCDDIKSDLSKVEFDWRELIDAYIEDGTLPEPKTDKGAKDHQQRAFAELATALETDDGEGIDFSGNDVSIRGGSDIAEPTLSVSIGGDSGGGSSQYRGRGQQAEVYVMAGVLSRIATWLEEYPGSDVFQFRHRFKRLHAEQQKPDYNYKWHVENVWSSDLLPILESPAEIDLATVTDWRTKVANGTPFTELPLIRLINVSMERGPGFDVIDPCGPLFKRDGQDDSGLWFTPVEVKAVDGATPPFRFRLTTNEYRQARGFIRYGNTPYVLRLVSVPEPGTMNWPDATDVVAEKVIETESELEDVIDSQRFEEVVKGGYMNMRIG